MQTSKIRVGNSTRAAFLQFGFWGGLILLVSACGGGSTPSIGSPDPGPTSCPAGIGGMPTACCDSTGVALSPPPSGVSGCVNTTPGTGPIANTGAKGVSSAGGATADIGNAQQLVGGEAATGMQGQYAGATAGGQASGNLANLVPNAGSVASNALSPTSGAGGGSGGGGGGGRDLVPASTTAALPRDLLQTLQIHPA